MNIGKKIFSDIFKFIDNSNAYYKYGEKSINKLTKIKAPGKLLSSRYITSTIFFSELNNGESCTLVNPCLESLLSDLHIDSKDQSIVIFKSCIQNRLKYDNETTTKLFKDWSVDFDKQDPLASFNVIIKKAIEINHPTFVKPKQYPLQQASIDTTWGRDDDCKKLKQRLKQFKVIVILATPGSGKTRFINYYISKNKLFDYKYIDYSSCSSPSLADMNLNNQIGNTAFNKENNSSLLVIDNFNIHSCDYTNLEIKEDDPNATSKIYKNIRSDFCKLANKIKIPTVILSSDFGLFNDDSLPAHFKFQLSSLSSDVVKQILGISESTNLDLMGKIKQASGNSILYISLLKKQYEKLVEKKLIDSSNISKEQVYLNLISNLSYLSKSFTIYNISAKSLYFKTDYTDKSVNIKSHLVDTYSKQLDILGTINNAALTMLKQICVFGWYEIPCYLLKEVILDNSFTDNKIKNTFEFLQKYNLVNTSSDNIYFNINPLLAHTIYLKYDISLTNAENTYDKLGDFLEEQLSSNKADDKGYLSTDSIYIFVKSLYPALVTKNQTKQATESIVNKKFDKIQNVVISAFIHLLIYGSIEQCKSLIEIFKFFEGKVSNHSSYYDKYILNLIVPLYEKLLSDSPIDSKEFDSLFNALNLMVEQSDNAKYTYSSIHKLHFKYIYEFTLYRTVDIILHNYLNNNSICLELISRLRVVLQAQCNLRVRLMTEAEIVNKGNSSHQITNLELTNFYEAIYNRLLLLYQPGNNIEYRASNHYYQLYYDVIYLITEIYSVIPFQTTAKKITSFNDVYCKTIEPTTVKIINYLQKSKHIPIYLLSPIIHLVILCSSFCKFIEATENITPNNPWDKDYSVLKNFGIDTKNYPLLSK